MCFCKSGILTSRPACIYEASHDQVQSGNTTKHIKIIQNQNYTKIQCLIISLRFLQSCNYTVLLTVPAGVGWVHIHLFAVWKPTPTKLSPSTRNNSSLLRLDHFLKSLQWSKPAWNGKGSKEGKVHKTQVQILKWPRPTSSGADFSENPPAPRRNNEHTPYRGWVQLFPVILDPYRSNQELLAGSLTYRLSKWNAKLLVMFLTEIKGNKHLHISLPPSIVKIKKVGEDIRVSNVTQIRLGAVLRVWLCHRTWGLRIILMRIWSFAMAFISVV